MGGASSKAPAAGRAAANAASSGASAGRAAAQATVRATPPPPPPTPAAPRVRDLNVAAEVVRKDNQLLQNLSQLDMSIKPQHHVVKLNATIKQTLDERRRRENAQDDPFEHPSVSLAANGQNHVVSNDLVAMLTAHHIHGVSASTLAKDYRIDEKVARNLMRDYAVYSVREDDQGKLHASWPTPKK